MRIAVLLALLPLASCRAVEVTYSTDFDAYHMFGDRLDAAKGTRVLCWPADADGARFRCVEDRVDRKISEQPVLTWPGDVRLIGCAGSVIVILPQGASDALRARAGRLADDLTRGSPSAGRHFVIADSSWQEVEGGRELALRLEGLHKRAAEWRATESDDGVFLTMKELNAMQPHVIVVLLEGEGDRNLVLQGPRRLSADRSRWESESRAILGSGEIRDLPARVSEKDETLPMVFEIVVPDSVRPPARDRAARLAADLLARPKTSVYLRREAAPATSKGVLPPGFSPSYIYVGQVVPVALPTEVAGAE